MTSNQSDSNGDALARLIFGEETVPASELTAVPTATRAPEEGGQELAALVAGRGAHADDETAVPTARRTASPEAGQELAALIDAALP